MKKRVVSVFVVLVIMLTQVNFVKADGKFDPKLKLGSKKDFSLELKKRDYEKAMKWHKKKTANALFGISLDLTAGYNSTNPNVEQRVSTASIGTSSKGGINFGALFNITVLGINLTTGLDFLNKKYEIENPIDSIGSVIDSVKKTYANQYLDIPINMTFSTMISENVGVSFSGGPYFGILLNPSNAANGFKDFDLGLNGILTGKYYLNPFVSILLGGKYQYGGLNNLLSNQVVEKVNTNTWGVFTGLSLGF